MSKTPKREPFGLGVTFLVLGGLVLLLAFKFQQSISKGEDVFNPFWVAGFVFVMIGIVIIQPYVTDEIRARKAKKESLQGKEFVKKEISNDLNDTLEKKEIINEINASIKKLEDKKIFRLCAIIVLIAICAIFCIIGWGVNSEICWIYLAFLVFVPCGMALLCFSALYYEACRDIKLVKSGKQKQKSILSYIISDYNSKESIQDRTTAEDSSSDEIHTAIFIKCNACGMFNIKGVPTCKHCKITLHGDSYEIGYIEAPPSTQSKVYIKCTCGQLNDTNYLYCISCGKNISSSDQRISISARFSKKIVESAGTPKEIRPNLSPKSEIVYTAFQKYGVDLLSNEYKIKDQIARIAPFDFEKFVATMFVVIGYEAHVTKASGDYGCDVVAEKDSIRLAIQCKHREDPGATVDQKAVREIHAAKDVSEYRADKAFVITNGRFTPAAKKLAYDLRVGLWDCENLLKKLNDIKNTLQFIEPKEGE